MRLVASIMLIALLLPLYCFSQGSYEMSEPIDISEAGRNKVLQMKNGNTLVFHFENKKSILVKVFDKTRKEIASKKHLTKTLDLNALDRTFFDGLHDIKEEAVLFVTQQVENRETMLRLKFNSVTGSLISEEKLIQSPSFKKRITTYLLKEKNVDEYTLVCYSQKSSIEAEANLKVIRYNANHQVIKEFPIEMDKAKYDFIDMVGCTIDRSGDIVFNIALSKIIHYPDVLEKHLSIYYLPKGDTDFRIKKIELPKGLQNISTTFTHNSFASNINILMEELWHGRVRYGLTTRDAKLSNYTMIIATDDMSSVQGVALSGKMLNDYLRLKTDTGHIFNGFVIGMHTTNVGLTTVAYQQKCIYKRFYTYEKDITSYIGISQYNDNGDEIWATVLPKSDLRYVHGDYPEAMYDKAESELLRTKCLFAKNNVYILFNELDKNFKLELNPDSDSMFRHETNYYTYNTTNAIYYTINRKKEISKQYLFGNPEPDDFKHIYTNSYDYDDDNNILAVLLLRNKNNKNMIHLAWKQL